MKAQVASGAFSMLSPSAPQTRIPSSEEARQILQDLVNQPLLHGSEALCNLLRYLVERSLQHPEQPAKEHQIATEVFGRPQSFDPRVDSTVRVQTSRLRSKLGEHYATTGSAQHWQVEIPKGSYAVLFHERSTPLEQPHVPAPPPRSRFRRSRILLSAGAGAVLLAVLLSTTVLHLKRLPAVARFWQAVLSTSAPPLIVFSNAEFVGRPETGLRYFNPQKDPSGAVFDQYTGVGEVMAVYQLHDTFDELGRHFLLKRGRLLNWDDTK
ncbi:MAG: helix-turn-helix domain-containing protein, partial [Bryobacteraceae bacterium]